METSLETEEGDEEEEREEDENGGEVVADAEIKGEKKTGGNSEYLNGFMTTCRTSCEVVLPHQTFRRLFSWPQDDSPTPAEFGSTGSWTSSASSHIVLQYPMMSRN